jgi:hypothetical protein
MQLVVPLLVLQLHFTSPALAGCMETAARARAKAATMKLLFMDCSFSFVLTSGVLVGRCGATSQATISQDALVRVQGRSATLQAVGLFRGQPEKNFQDRFFSVFFRGHYKLCRRLLLGEVAREQLQYWQRLPCDLRRKIAKNP